MIYVIVASLFAIGALVYMLNVTKAEVKRLENTIVERELELIEEVNRTGDPIVITLNGEAKAVLQSIYTFEQEEREKKAFHKLMEERYAAYQAGKGKPLEESLKKMDQEVSDLLKPAKRKNEISGN